MKNAVVPTKRIPFNNKDVKVKLENYNRQLSRSLKTLEYIYMLEINYEKKCETKRFKELLKFKNNIQKHIIKIAQKINYYKSL